jgi:hypothetical protein
MTLMTLMTLFSGSFCTIGARSLICRFLACASGEQDGTVHARLFFRPPLAVMTAEIERRVRGALAGFDGTAENPACAAGAAQRPGRIDPPVKRVTLP